MKKPWELKYNKSKTKFMDKTYNPKEHEEKIYSFWEKGEYFRPKIDREKPQKPFVIMLPPPNVTGSLHIGHALTASIEDMLVRYHRMQGAPTLWLPGTDHAGIATQVVVERELSKSGKTRFDLGKERFIEKVWEWVEKSGKQIESQERKIGISVDWERNRFTMDKAYQETVQIAFKALKDKGLIYQGEYIVNWCPRCQTAISDLENIYEETKRVLWYLDYGTLTIATQRPETIFADTAVAVNPKDRRYKKLVGHLAVIPLVGKKIPIIADEAVEKDFGTGALKITPAHDPADFEIGRRHNLSHPQVINNVGKIDTSPLVPKKYWGISVAEARIKVADDLKKDGFVKKEEQYITRVGHCQRCGTITEPLISKQWFVKTTAMAKPALDAVKKGKIKIIPKRFEKTYFQWLGDIHDWCISRQIWWGHEIPGSDDVLDTWFSSSLWPFATLGWSRNTEDYKNFYPTTVIETGYDILFFWVARMIMMGIELTGKPPFETVYLHGLVRDIKGRKMSKTLGNVVDPLDYIEKYGADALRMALVVGTTPGNDSKISEEKVVGYRNFANKLWNIGRYILANENTNKKIRMHSNNSNSHSISISPHPDDKWILEELDKTTSSVTLSLDNFKLHLAIEEIYDFIWHKFADIYIEKTKARREEAQPTLLLVLDHSLRLLHPFMPFITETIWQETRKLKQQNFVKKGKREKTLGYAMFTGEALIVAKWPEVKK